jgi:hypothetical protein
MYLPSPMGIFRRAKTTSGLIPLIRNNGSSGYAGGYYKHFTNELVLIKLREMRSFANSLCKTDPKKLHGRSFLGN